MRLIGGSISDTPIKEVGDGSAFNVGGGVVEPSASFLESLGERDSMEVAFLPGYTECWTATSTSMASAVRYPASGNPNHHYSMMLGKTVHTTADNPTFTGTVGDESGSEYFNFDGGDVMVNTGTVSNSFLTSMHKDNAVFSVLFAFYHVGDGSDNYTIGTTNSSVRSGWILRASTNAYQWYAFHASSTVNGKVHGTALNANAWNMCGISLDEASGAGNLMLNGTNNAFTSTYTSPTTVDCSPLTFGGYDLVPSAPNNTRIGDVIFWNTAIGTTALGAASAILATKYGV